MIYIVRFKLSLRSLRLYKKSFKNILNRYIECSCKTIFWQYFTEPLQNLFLVIKQRGNFNRIYHSSQQNNLKCYNYKKNFANFILQLLLNGIVKTKQTSYSYWCSIYLAERFTFVLTITTIGVWQPLLNLLHFIHVQNVCDSFPWCFNDLY